MTKRKSVDELFKGKGPVSLDELFKVCSLAEKQQHKRKAKGN